jgi:hypothetical protein
MLDLIDYMEDRWDEDEESLRDVLAAVAIDRCAIDPELLCRLLSDLSAKRYLLRLHRPIWPDDDQPCCQVCGDPMLESSRAPWPCATLLALSQPFAYDRTLDPAWRLPSHYRASQITTPSST